jgi:catechol 2,3-dioxygenase-like lactoylglutathione lyase family enzyme
MLNETKKQFTTGAATASEPPSGVTPAGSGVHILAFLTSNYDAMIKFYRDFGFTVIEDPHDQLTPFFEHGRAARVRRGEFEFQLEESESVEARACFNLFLTDYPDADIEKVKAMGYTCDYESFGDTHSFRTPDGGTLVL